MDKSLNKQNVLQTFGATFANEQLDIRKMRFVKITPEQIVQDIDQQGPGAIGTLCDRRYISQLLELLGRARLLEHELDGWGLLSETNGSLTAFCLVDIEDFNPKDEKVIKIELLCSDTQKKFGQGALLLALVLAYYVHIGYNRAILQIATRDPEHAERLSVFYGRFGFFKHDLDTVTLRNDDVLSALLKSDLYDFLTWHIAPLNLTNLPLDVSRPNVVVKDGIATRTTQKRPRWSEIQEEPLGRKKTSSGRNETVLFVNT